MGRHVLVAALMAVTVASAGCASSEPIVKWRHGVEAFVREQGRGELASLRGQEAARGVPGFAMLGVRNGGIRPIWAERVDVSGVLLGKHEVGGHSWWLWLVGVTRFTGNMTYVPLEHATVTDIRAIAMRPTDGGELEWRTGGGNHDSLTRYNKEQRTAWVAEHPEDSGDPDDPRVIFPLASDEFVVNVVGSRARVTHAATGAAWEVEIRGQEQMAHRKPNDE